MKNILEGMSNNEAIKFIESRFEEKMGRKMTSEELGAFLLSWAVHKESGYQFFK